MTVLAKPHTVYRTAQAVAKLNATGWKDFTTACTQKLLFLMPAKSGTQNTCSLHSCIVVGDFMRPLLLMSAHHAECPRCWAGVDISEPEFLLSFSVLKNSKHFWGLLYASVRYSAGNSNLVYSTTY